MIPFAYLDPGTGAMLLQGIVAAFLGAVFVVKLYWQRLKAALGLGPRPVIEEASGDAVD